MAWMPIVLVVAALLVDVFFLPRAVGGMGWIGLRRIAVSGDFVSSAWIRDGNAVSDGLARAGWGPGCRCSGGADTEGNAVEWAWAMNAAASVLGSVLAMVIAIQFGLTVTLACGVAAYICRSVAAAERFDRNAQLRSVASDFVMMQRRDSMGVAVSCRRKRRIPRSEEIICRARSSSNGRNFASA
jgi:hypothetical protein